MYKIAQFERCHREMFGDLIVTCQTPNLHGVITKQPIQAIPYKMCLKRPEQDDVMKIKKSPRKMFVENERRNSSTLVEELLMEIYSAMNDSFSGYNSTSGKSCLRIEHSLNFDDKGVEELRKLARNLKAQLERVCLVLEKRLKRRDALRLQQETFCDVIDRKLHEILAGASKNSYTDMRFSIQPLPGDTGFSQWVSAMKMVAQLPGGIPPEFRKRLWLTMAEKHLNSKGVNWLEVERSCFSEWSHPADAELGVQIVKDLHRTGCSLFCGKDGQENQILLKRVLLAYARWNKSVGYCQGFNMLAALILQVTDKNEAEALKLMIYLIEGVLPDSYFADSLRGLSVDMAVFRELLRSKLPKLSKHLDKLQTAAKDGTRSYEPPLTNVFTMQWFLTLFCNCLPHGTVLRIWDLIFLEGNEILLRTALAIWQVLENRIITARSADEFYCLMGALTRELLEFDLVDANSLVKAIVVIGPLAELNNLREHYLYNINPWGKTLNPVVEKQLKVYSKQSLALDISALKKQYEKLRERQRQAHIIFSAAITRQPPPTPPVTINHLLIGKSALVPSKRLGPVQGSIPPPPVRTQISSSSTTLHWKDAEKNDSSSSSSDTELCDENTQSSDEDENVNSQFKDNPCVEEKATTADNILSAENSAVVDLCTSSSQILQTEERDDDDDGDFEKFLADRIKISTPEEIAEEKINFARRNSERALQIIQENSMILHRIMQCQSRLSPSPPKPPAIEIDPDPGISSGIDDIPSYKSRYNSILEKSKSLDEKYNELILNSKPTVCVKLNESKSSPIIEDYSGCEDYKYKDLGACKNENDDDDGAFDKFYVGNTPSSSIFKDSALNSSIYSYQDPSSSKEDSFSPSSFDLPQLTRNYESQNFYSMISNDYKLSMPSNVEDSSDESFNKLDSYKK